MEIASRASYRGQVTKLVNSALEYLQSDDSKKSEKLDDLEEIEEELQVLLDRLTAANECLKKANIDVINSIKPEDVNKEAESVTEYEDKAIGAITRLKYRLNKIRQRQGQYQTQSNSSDLSPEATAPAQSSPIGLSPLSAVNLQKLQPRKFTGDFKEWVPFWEQYRVLIHENSSLSVVDKFNYLQTVLTGKATETLVGFTPSEANYNAAIALLKEEYGNNEKIVDHTMQELLSIQPITSKTNVAGLRRLYNSVLASTRSLSALGVPTSNYFVMLKGVLLRCLPNELRVDFHRYYDDAENNITSHTDQAEEANNTSVSDNSSDNSSGSKQVNCLLKFLKREVESLEKANSNTTKSRVLNQPRTVKTAYGLFTAETSNECMFCKKGNHDSKECRCEMKLPDKKELLRKEGRCFRCLKRGHNSKACKVRVVCKTCGRRHATSMCDPLFTSAKRSSTSDTKSVVPTNINNTSTSFTQPSLNLYMTEKTQHGNVYLQTACAFASSEICSVPLYVRVIMDGGSQLSFIKSSLAKRLNLPIIGVHSLSVIPFGSAKPKPSKMCNKVRLVLHSQYDDQAVVFDAIEVPEICFDVLSEPSIHTTADFRELVLADARIPGQQIEEGISILIGADSYWQFATGEIKRLTERLTAINTVLGWTIQGSSHVQPYSAGAKCVTSLYVCACEDIERLWKMDVLGISSEDNKVVSKDLNFNIRRNGNRYEVSLPWKPMALRLNDNRTGALVRLQTLVRRLCKAGRLNEYSAAIHEMVTTEIAEIAPEKAKSENRTFYLPHRPVYREDKETTKLRIVFDASAHAPNYCSLNDCLEVGENLLPELLVILLKFRTGRVGIIADIEKAFLQILLNENDRDSHRFLWFGEAIKDEQNLPAVQVFRMTRVTFGVTSSPFLLAATIQRMIDEAMMQYKETCEILRNSFYVDDFVASVDDESVAERIYREANLIFKDASMTLRKWNSNAAHVRQYFPTEDRCLRTKKVLGLRWVVATDELEVDLDSVFQYLKSDFLRATKRVVLKLMAKIFDPLGILTPWSVTLKILFQNIWRQKLDWDEELPSDLKGVWVACCDEIQSLTDIAVPRHFTISGCSIELHVFADASQFAYGAVAYARTLGSNGVISVQFICAKSRVAPLKIDHQNELTIPKLELTAALIASRLLSYIQRNLKMNFSDTFLWTDSKIALFWIQGTKKRWKPYIESRVKEIRILSDISSWRHCRCSIELHVFADASQFAYGAVAYARTLGSNGVISVQFICAKSRVAPLKIDHQNELTIPKLELTAALIASRLLSYIQRNLKMNFSDTFLWTDSKIALFWIQGTKKRWKPYIESRVKEIRILSDISSWRHCPGAVNPADLLTRGISATSFVNSSSWFHGPTWLREEVQWSESTDVNISLCALVAEETDSGSSEDSVSPILDCEQFSNWRRLLRVTAYIFRAVDCFKQKQMFPMYLSAEEIARAQEYWLHQVQYTYFYQEIAALRKGKGIPSNSKLLMLSPFLDDKEFLRVGGRLQLVVENVNEAHPLILSKSSHITKLIVIDAHEKTFHAGVSSTLSRLRSTYWIIKGRQLIKGVIQRCFVCKVLRGTAATQPFAPLPRDRILTSRPFAVTGMDFAGPLYVAEPGNQRKKMYLLLFTCAAVRAVHIECTMDLTTESCLLAIRRFLARRGVPHIIYSDNATTFKRASSELRQLNNLRTNEQFVGFLSELQIKWKFIVERAPWWGGFWERLIGVVKAALRAAIGKATLSVDQLQTLLTEVEGVINSRPLTYCGDDPLDLAPLTPAHFINGTNEVLVDSSCEKSSGKELRKQWKDRLRCLATFKRRWFREYLQQLRSLHQVKDPVGCNIQVGDVVLLEDKSLPRTLWHLAIVQRLFPGRDGRVRACEIRLGSGSILRRPIQLLYPLEITDSS